jgi:hypothetical protein
MTSLHFCMLTKNQTFREVNILDIMFIKHGMIKQAYFV